MARVREHEYFSSVLIKPSARHSSVGTSTMRAFEQPIMPLIEVQ